jgi:arginyl-tRNA synthetase
MYCLIYVITYTCTYLLTDQQLCEYLFELSQRFNQFYEKCPVLKAESPELQRSRAALCSLTADTLKLSLGLLGIRTVEKL